MARRALVLSTALAAVLWAAPAHATTCPFVTDPAGDAQIAGLVPGVAETDILSADVATGATTLVGVVRVTDITMTTTSTLGVAWNLGWRLDGVQHTLSARRSPHPAGGVIVRVEYEVAGVPQLVPVTVAIDATDHSVTWVVARSDVPGLATGATFSPVTVVTSLFGGSADQAFNATDTYVDGDAGCIPAA